MATDVVRTVIIEELKVGANITTDQLIPAITDPVSLVTIDGQGNAIVFRYAVNTDLTVSIGLTMPTDVFFVDNTPVNGAGTLEVSFINQNPALVFSTPVSTIGVPTFRSLVKTDIPDLSGSYLTLVTHDGTLSGNGTVASPLTLSSGVGTVTSVTLASSDFSISNPTITTSGTITANLKNSGVTPGVYGTSSLIPVVTVNSKGVITSLSTVAVSGGGGSGTVTSVSATVPSFLSVTGSPITTSGTLAIDLASTPINGQLLIGNGTGFSYATLTAGSNITITNSSGGITIASSGGGGSISNLDGGVANSVYLITQNITGGNASGV
jgi:hypothetical protein